MATEKPIVEDATLSEIRTVRGELQAFRDVTERRFDGLTERMARVEGLIEGFRMAFDQMDKRLSDMSSQMDRRFSTIQWFLGLVVVIQLFMLGKMFVK